MRRSATGLSCLTAGRRLRDGRIASLFRVAEALARHGAEARLDSFLVNASAQFAGIAALKGPQDLVAAMRRISSDGAGRDRLLVQLPGVCAATPEGGVLLPFQNVSRTGGRQAPGFGFIAGSCVATIGGPDFGVYGEGTSALLRQRRSKTSSAARTHRGSLRRPAARAASACDALFPVLSTIKVTMRPLSLQPR